jgi:hypothetical protein
MKTTAHTFALLCALLLAGCDFKVPLVEKPELPFDPALIGLWELSDPEDPQERKFRLLFVPLDKTECMVSYFGHPRKADDGDGTEWLGRACRCETAGLSLLQVKWLETDSGGGAEVFGASPYQYVACTVKDGILTLRMLNAEKIKAETSAELAAAIAARKDSPDLFHEEGLPFTRVKYEKKKWHFFKPRDPEPAPARPPVPRRRLGPPDA